MSGIALGTVVIEAGRFSGAKMQARVALEQGKKLFLLRSLVEQQDWARSYVACGAVLVAHIADVLDELDRVIELSPASWPGLNGSHRNPPRCDKS